MGTHFKGNKSEENTLNAFIKLMRSTESLNNRLNRHLAEADLTVSQFGVLEVLHHLGPLNQRTIGEKLLKSGGNITMVIDNLERCGHVERQKDPNDRRAVLIHLTESGEKFIADFFPKHLEKIKEEFSVLSEEEKNTLAEICKKLGVKEEE
ncbi:MarR family transcriptional regulator [Rhodohalobacter sp. SW132]|uniref:MarR family winged helix-turn-helix transcriptional regulator n=1 Tax=Rhodohalobacter sp. SW132 TaxID=2293433 RepID=UPI000E2265FF|nr:MarR family transcriptional regulator [Rhodohalobacter sp. SW132]REL39106.1 MarR family transcriptional regulator [Rhodohalobacter sp. SW132]